MFSLALGLAVQILREPGSDGYLERLHAQDGFIAIVILFSRGTRIWARHLLTPGIALYRNTYNIIIYNICFYKIIKFSWFLMVSTASRCGLTAYTHVTWRVSNAVRGASIKATLATGSGFVKCIDAKGFAYLESLFMWLAYHFQPGQHSTLGFVKSSANSWKGTAMFCESIVFRSKDRLGSFGVSHVASCLADRNTCGPCLKQLGRKRTTVHTSGVLGNPMIFVA